MHILIQQGWDGDFAFPTSSRVMSMPLLRSRQISSQAESGVPVILQKLSDTWYSVQREHLLRSAFNPMKLLHFPVYNDAEKASAGSGPRTPETPG